MHRTEDVTQQSMLREQQSAQSEAQRRELGEGCEAGKGGW